MCLAPSALLLQLGFLFIYRIPAHQIPRLFPTMAGHRKVLHLAFFHATHRALAAGGAGNIEAWHKAFTHRTATEQVHRGPMAGQRSGQIVFYLNQELRIRLRGPTGGILHLFRLRGGKLDFFVKCFGFKQRPSVGAGNANCLYADHTKHQARHSERLAA